MKINVCKAQDYEFQSTGDTGVLQRRNKTSHPKAQRSEQLVLHSSTCKERNTQATGHTSKLIVGT